MVSLPEYPDPHNADYATYAQKVRAYNRVLQTRARDSLAQYFELQVPEHVVVATTGSDGRFEKGPQSKIELICMHEQAYDPANEQLLLARIHSIYGEVFHEEIEVKVTDDFEKPVSGYAPNGNFFVTRMLDAQLLYGNPAVLKDAQARVEDEISNKDDLGKKILNFMKDQRATALQVTKRGTSKFRGTDFRHFCVDQGVAFYDDSHLSAGGQGSFKYGPLRLVQYKLATDLITAFQTLGPIEKLSVEDIPSHIPERLYWLQSARVTQLSQNEIDTLADSYSYFLWLYHRSQDAFRHKGKNSIEFDVKEAKERLEDLPKLVAKPWITRS